MCKEASLKSRQTRMPLHLNCLSWWYCVIVILICKNPLYLRAKRSYCGISFKPERNPLCTSRETAKASLNILIMMLIRHYICLHFAHSRVLRISIKTSSNPNTNRDRLPALIDSWINTYNSIYNSLTRPRFYIWKKVIIRLNIPRFPLKIFNLIGRVISSPNHHNPMLWIICIIFEWHLHSIILPSRA